MLKSRRIREPSQVLEQLRLGSKGEEADVRLGLVKLVLTVVEVVRQVLERQAVRRVDAGDLTPEEIERLGTAFIEIKGALFSISREMGIRPEELTAELGAIVKTGDKKLDEASLVDLLDRLMDKGAVVAGRVKLTVADIDLVTLDLLAMLYPVYKTKGGR
jgi:Gas vesicle protein K/Gas vesicle protein